MRKWSLSSSDYVRSVCFVVSIAMVAASLAACGKNGDGLSVAADNPYAAEFEKNYHEAKTPLVRSILEDGVITEVEMNEFAGVFRRCMADRGLHWSWSEEEGESIDFGMETNVDVEWVNDMQMQCYDETDYLYIMPLHDFISTNPDNLSADEYNTKILECMKLQDLIDKDMDPDYFLSFYVGVGSSEKAEYKKYITHLEDEHDPDYDPVKSERYWKCVTDPLNTKGDSMR